MGTLTSRKHSDIGYLYRYQIRIEEPFAGLPVVKLKLLEFPIIKTTPKGFWIDEFGYSITSTKRWVSIDGLRRYAHQTKEGALTSFIKRSERRIKILESQLTTARFGLYDANKELGKLTQTIDNV